MSARDNILGRLRAASIPAPPPLPDVAGWFASHRRNEDLAQRVARLRSMLEAAHAEVHDTTAADWPALLLRIAAAKGLRTLLIGTGTPHGGALEALRPEQPQLVRYAEPIDSWRDTMFDGIDAGLTRARSGIAETGCLILWPDADEPRLMSLVPPLHFVLLDTATIHADLHSAMAAENWKDGLPTNALLISGPSKTADIQQTLAYGAHGPREVIVLLLHAEGTAP
ncbi:MAG: lactate utilization protein [Telluria sp.]|nr:lactate utilization protein [Telluria sp.]